MKCYETKNEDCSKETHTKLGIDYEETKNCVEKSFNKAEDYESENSSLRDERIYSE